MVLKYDLHIHSKYSYDSLLEPKVIVQAAMKKGMNGIAVTDHNTIKGGLKAKEYETKDFEIIVGSETCSNRGDVIGLFLNEEIKSRSPLDVIDEIKAQGGIVIIPHPFDNMRSSTFHPTYKCVGSIDAVEGFNARCINQKYNMFAVDYGEIYSVTLIGSSDAHCANEIANGWTEIEDSDNIRDAILNGNTTIRGNKSWIMNHVFSKGIKKLKNTRIIYY
jgi:predicted metal-dependent phosphoesterase TrpH